MSGNSMNSNMASNGNNRKLESQVSGDWSIGEGQMPLPKNVGPLALMFVCPAFSMVFFHVVSEMSGDFGAFARLCLEEGAVQTVRNVWPNPWDGDAWRMIFAFLGFELLLQRLVPGKKFVATVTPTGNVPVYRANGTACYIITMLCLLGLAQFGWIRPALVYDKFGEILAAMNVFATAFCIMLLIKSRVAPTNSDFVHSGSLVTDYFWGSELHPRILGWDVKMFTNCRAGMMFWAVGILCFAHKNIEVNGSLQAGMAVNVALQLIYITKFFHWEMGYMCSMDIQHDRAGYYICWGCLVWVPSVYTSHSFYLAEHCPDAHPLVSLAIFLTGFLMIYLNYDSDNQRYIFRQTHGNCTIWGKKPDKIVAEYTTADGRPKKSLLLLAGWWKVSRHFHYVPEILASLCWSLPALDSGFVGPYFYVIYLTILLTDRAYRDDDRCSKKYGPYWDAYCKEVPYKIVPGIV